MNVAVMILLAVLAVNVIFVAWRSQSTPPPTPDDVALEQAEAQLAGEFDAYADRLVALYGKGE